MNISRFSIKHPVIIGMLLIVLIVFGFYSIYGQNISFMSDISMPSVLVITVYPGASASTVEEDVTKILEDDFVTLPNFKSISSTSSASMSQITITFTDGTTPEDQLPEVRNRISRLESDLPEGLAGSPNAFVGGATMLPVISFIAEAGQDPGKLTEFLENTVVPRLTRIEGVSEVSIKGSEKLQGNICLNLDELTGKGISVTNVYQALKNGNVQLPAGNGVYKNKSIDITYQGGFSSLEDIKSLPIGFTPDNVLIHLEDVAEITLSYPDKEEIVTDGENYILLVEITKLSQGNVMGINTAVKNELEKITKETNGGIKFHIVSDDTRIISASLASVITSGITGIIIAVLVIYLFLGNLGTTFIIGISIPLSILFTFIGMKILGISVNLMSITGIVVALGMVVDGSIVMLEQIFRYYKKGEGLSQSIERGSGEVSASILASVATTAIVFVPLAALSGIIGSILGDVSKTIIMAILASFLTAVFVVPYLMKVVFSQKRFSRRKDREFKFMAKGMIRLEEFYKKTLLSALKNRKKFLLCSVGILLLSVFITGALGITFIPSTDNSDFYINLKVPGGYRMEDTDEKIREVSALIRKEVPELQSMVWTVGGQSLVFLSGGTADNVTSGHIVLVPVAERKRRVQEIMIFLQEKLTGILPGCEIKITNGGFDRLIGYVAGGGGYGLKFSGDDINILYETAEKYRQILQNDPDVLSVSIDTSFDAQSLVFDPSHEKLSSLGLSSMEAGLTTAILFQGMDVGEFTNSSDNTRYKLRLFSNLTGNKITRDDIANIHLITQGGEQVSFDSLGDIKTELNISQINHTSRSKTITVNAVLRGEDTKGINERINQHIKQNPLPPGVILMDGGIMELMNDSIPPLLTALGIALFLVYTVMVLQFERFKQPLVVMVTIPFCFIGVVLGLLLFGSTMNILSMMGIIALGGIVVNNGIILIDYINLLRDSNKDKSGEEEGDLIESIITGSASRLRPILMTTLTTMLGVVPMALDKGEGAEIYAPLGQAIAGGLLTSTLITLFIIPILYFITERKKIKGNGIAVIYNEPQDNGRKGNGKGQGIKILSTILIACFLFTGGQKLYGEEAGKEQGATPEIRDTQNLSYENLLDSMETNNKELAKLREEWFRSTLDTKDAKAGFQPQIDFTVNATYMANPLIGPIDVNVDDFIAATGMPLPSTGKTVRAYDGMDKENYGLKLSLTQPIFTWGKVFNSVKLYSGISQVQAARLRDQKEKLVSQLKGSLISILYLEEIKGQLIEQKQYADKLTGFLKSSQETGMTVELDVMEIEVKTAELDLGISLIEQQIENLEIELETLTGIPGLNFSRIKTAAEETEKTIDLYKEISGTKEKALSSERPLLEMAYGMYDVNLQAEKISKGDIYWKPDLAFQMTLGYSGSVLPFSKNWKDNDTYTADFTVALKTIIWDGGVKLRNITRSKSNVQSALLDLENTKENISRQVEKTETSVKIQQKKLIYQEKVLEYKELALKSQEEMYNEGYSGEADVLKKMIEVSTSKTDILETKINLVSDILTLDYLSGNNSLQ